MQQQTPLNIYIPDKFSEQELETFIRDYRGVVDMRLLPNTGARSDMPNHQRMLTITNYNMDSSRLMMVATRAGVKFEGTVDFSAYFGGNRNRF